MAKVNAVATTFSGLAPARPTWQEAPMSDSNGPQAGGVILAAAILLGAVIGVAAGQSSIGVLAGVAVGGIAVLLVWWRDRAKRGE